jgi:nitrite reductase/ring-hydroxylating ferredoxin subunit
MNPAKTAEWQDLGPAKDFEQKPVTEVHLGKTAVAITCRNSEFGAISGVCNHVGGPLGQGTLDGDYVVCPWHHYKFHWRTGEGEPGFETDRVPSYEVRVEGGRLLLRTKPVTPRHKLPHDPHPLARPIRREEGPVRVVGISATVMDRQFPRVSTSELLLQAALDHAEKELGCGTRLLKLDSLKFRNCEGYYSKSAHACTWPCSITQMDPADQMDQVYEALVHWADVVLVATPIRWGSASSLYCKMAERLNCVHRRLPHHRRAGQHPVGRRAVAGLLLRTGLPLPAVPLHRAFAGLVGGGHGEQRDLRRAQRRAALGRPRSDPPCRGARPEAHRPGRGLRKGEPPGTEGLQDG